MVDLDLLSCVQVEDEIKNDIFRTMDPFWAIDEQAVEAMQKQFGQKRVQKEIDDALPSVLKDVKYKACIDELRALRKKPLMAWAGEAAGRDLTCVLETLGELREGSVNQSKFLTSPYLKTVEKRLPFFCLYERATEKKGEIQHLIGKEAAARLLGDLEEKLNLKKATLADVEYLKSFSCLLESGALQHFGVLAERARVECAGTAGPSASSAGGKSGAASGSKDGQPAAGEDVSSWSFFS